MPCEFEPKHKPRPTQSNTAKKSASKPSTVEPRFNVPLFNEFEKKKDTLRPGQNYSKMYGIKPRYNEPRYNEHDPEAQTQNLPRYNELQCQHVTEDKR